MFLRSSEIFVRKIIHWILHGIIPLQDYLGMRLLKHSKVKLELLTDPDTCLRCLKREFVEVVAMILKSLFGKANNKYMGENV